MAKPNHSPSPWSIGYHSNLINDRDGKAVCQFWRRDDKDYANKNWNVKRIVECVNALEGIEDPIEWVKNARINQVTK
jgi:hypothetical protein